MSPRPGPGEAQPRGTQPRGAQPGLPAPTADSRARFTGRGWAFLAAGALCLALATWLGRKDVLALALFLGGVPLFSVLSLYVVRPRVQLLRGVEPALVTAGDAAVVGLRVRHGTARAGRLGGRRHARTGPAGSAVGSAAEGTAPAAGAVTVHERVPESLGGDRELDVEAGGRAAGYTVRPQRRGVWALGPATVRVADPFGLATGLLDVSERTLLHVAPDAVELPEISTDRLRDAGTAASRTAPPRPGPDNVTVREYRHGDPMRRVHWAASAKHGQLMVRQEDPLSTRRLSLLLDLDETSWPGERQWAGELPSTAGFEWAVSFSAAALEHLTRREAAVHAIDTFGRPLPRSARDDDGAARARAAAVTDVGAEDARHGLARVHPVPAPAPGRNGPPDPGRNGRPPRPGDDAPDPGRDGTPDGPVNEDPLAARFDRDGLAHPVLLVSGELGRAAAERVLRATARSAAGSAVLVAGPDRAPDGAAALEAAGWSVVVVGVGTAPEDAWARLGARAGGTGR